jgi:hypothetical protein
MCGVLKISLMDLIVRLQRVVCFLPNEFMAPANQVVQEEASLDIDEAEQLGLMA